MCKCNKDDELMVTECECEDCECLEAEESEEEVYFTRQEVLDIVEECIEEITPKINIDFECVQDIEVDEKEFCKGVEVGSYFAGFYSALIGAGLSAKDAYEITLNQSTSIANERLAVIQQPQTTVTTMQNSI